MQPESKFSMSVPHRTDSLMDEIFERCETTAPNFGIQRTCFKTLLRRNLEKYLGSELSDSTDFVDARIFLEQLQANDLFLAAACAAGNERAWWEFDQQHRGYLERVARHLAKSELDAQEVIDSVYVELYGTRVVDGQRLSKFSTYGGRGSLRGWLRTVVWHSLVDLHRRSHDEVSLDEMTENIGEGMAHASFAAELPGGEDEMIDEINRSRYRGTTLEALRNAFTSLDDHEKLLLLYYHVENLKLREIARLVENETSPLRGWFQRRSNSSDHSHGRTHESTIMRWLEKCYAKVLQIFKNELELNHKLSHEEIKICLDLASRDIDGSGVFNNLSAN